MKLEVVDWSDDAYNESKRRTGIASSLVIARVEIPEFKGFSFDGGRLEIDGVPETIWVTNQWSVHVVDEWSEEGGEIDNE